MMENSKPEQRVVKDADDSKKPVIKRSLDRKTLKALANDQKRRAKGRWHSGMSAEEDRRRKADNAKIAEEKAADTRTLGGKLMGILEEGK